MEKGSRGRTDEFTVYTHSALLYRTVWKPGETYSLIRERERRARTDWCHAYADLRRFEDRLVTADRPTDRTGAKAVGESRMPVIDIN